MQKNEIIIRIKYFFPFFIIFDGAEAADIPAQTISDALKNFSHTIWIIAIALL